MVNFIIDNKITKRTYEPLCRLGYFKDIFENCKILEDIVNACRNKKKSQTIDGIAQQILDDNVGEKDWDKTQKIL